MVPVPKDRSSVADRIQGRGMGLWVYRLSDSGESSLVGGFTVDIPQLAVNGIQVGDECFVCVYSLRSSSKNGVLGL